MIITILERLFYVNCIIDYFGLKLCYSGGASFFNTYFVNNLFLLKSAFN